MDDFELDEANQLAYRGGRAIELSEKETQLLAYLMRSPNQLLTHDQIFQYLWERLKSQPVMLWLLRSAYFVAKLKRMENLPDSHRLWQRLSLWFLGLIGSFA